MHIVLYTWHGAIYISWGELGEDEEEDGDDGGDEEVGKGGGNCGENTKWADNKQRDNGR